MENENTQNNSIIDDVDSNENDTSQQLSLVERLIKMRQEWTNEVETLNADMKSLPTLDNLLNKVFVKRQNAVDMYYATMGVLQKQTRCYKKQYADLYNKLKMGTNGIRYTNEQSINMQIEAQLSDALGVINELKIFTDFMLDTIKTIDGIQYAISHKIKIYELVNGLKY